MKHDSEKLTERHKQLIHSDCKKVQSHVQRDEGEWIQNTIMIEGCDVPFQYRRKKMYRSLQGQSVNITYYVNQISVAGIPFETMQIVRIKIA